MLTPDYPADPDDLITLALGFDWERRGCTPQEVVTKVSGLNEEVAEEIVALLRGFHAYQIVKYGDEDPYGVEARYEEIGPNAGPFWGIWNTVPDGIRHQARFFNEEAENALDSLFEDLFDLTTSMGEPVVQTIDPEDSDTFIWRARKASTLSQVETILGNPAAELAPPPPDHATPGRMNASGIPVFYGAFEQDTCIAEVRPPVGSYVVMGKFKLLRAIRLLDLNLLRHVFIETTYFDPLYPDRSNRVAFLQRLSEELTKPVMPEDEEREYLATQVIAEYLAQKLTPRIDGILFGSSQTDPAGLNVVLFNHASKVQQYKAPEGLTIEVSFPSPDEDNITIWEFVEPGSQHQQHVDIDHQADSADDVGNQPPKILEGKAPTLALVLNSLVVHDIKANKPAYTTLTTERHRTEKPDITFWLEGGDDATSVDLPF